MLEVLPKISDSDDFLTLFAPTEEECGDFSFPVVSLVGREKTKHRSRCRCSLLYETLWADLEKWHFRIIFDFKVNLTLFYRYIDFFGLSAMERSPRRHRVDVTKKTNKDQKK